MFWHRDECLNNLQFAYDLKQFFKILDKYADFKKPLQMTEITIPAYTLNADDEELMSDGVTINVKRIGDRPCAGELDGVKQSALVECCKRVVEDVINRTVICKSASTDCNIPLSMGIPAVCIGVYEGGGSHTREEWVNKTSLKCGLEIVIKTTERIMDAL